MTIVYLVFNVCISQTDWSHAICGYWNDEDDELYDGNPPGEKTSPKI